MARSLCACVLLGASPSGAAGGLTIVDDLFVGVWSPFGTRWEASSRVCVQGTESFRVIATSVDGDARFTLDDGAGSEVDYRVFWQRGNGPGRGEKLASGVPSRRVISGDATPGCDGGNARIGVRIGRRAMERAPPGIYADTLLLMLSPL